MLGGLGGARWGARVIKDTEKVSVLLGEAGGKEVVVKTVRVGRLRAMVGRTKLRRDCDAWERLVEDGILVPDYFSLVMGRDERGVLVESLVMARAPGCSLLWELARGELGVQEEHQLARAIGAQVSDLIGEADVENCDHKASNIQVVVGGTDPVIALLDLDGIMDRRFFNGDEMDWASRMLAKLAIECIGCGVLPRRALLMRVVDSMRSSYEQWLEAERDDEIRHELWHEIRRIIDEHGDPTPKDDPLEFDRRMMGLD